MDKQLKDLIDRLNVWSVQLLPIQIVTVQMTKPADLNENIIVLYK